MNWRSATRIRAESRVCLLPCSITLLALVGTLLAACSDDKKIDAPFVTPGSGGPSVGDVTEPPAYEIVKREDVSFGSTVRVVFRIGVSSELNEEQIRQIAQEVISQETARNEVNAIGFFFYLPGTDTNGLYSAGKADWAPDGVWANADSVGTGDYSSHELVVEVAPAINSVTPSDGAAAIPEATRRQMYYDLVVEQDRGNIEGAEETIAQRYDVDVAIVEEIAIEGGTELWPIPPAP